MPVFSFWRLLMNIDNLWASFEENKSSTKNIEIMKLVYFNKGGLKIKDIRKEFDSWSIDLLMLLHEETSYMPTYEMDTELNIGFGEVAPIFNFFEAATECGMAEDVLKLVKPKKKRFF